MSVQEVVTLEDRRNSLLNRREVKALFRGAAGKIRRTEAAEKIASQLNVDKKHVIPVNLRCQTGMTDVQAIFYIYDDEKDAAKHLKKRLRSSRPNRRQLLPKEAPLLKVPRSNG